MLRQIIKYRHYYLTKIALTAAWPFIMMKWKTDRYIKYRFGIPYGVVYGAIFAFIYWGIYGSLFGFIWGLGYGFLYGMSYGKKYHSIYNDNLAFIYCVEFGLM